MARFTCNFISYVLNRAVDITVIIPSVTMPEIYPGQIETGVPCTHIKDKPYPLLYLLHGLGNNHMTWCGYTNIELYAEERNIAVVMLSAENKMYIDSEKDKFFEFISHELPEFMKGMFPISDRPEDTYIAGLSMGGFGSLIHAFSQPERFAAVGCFSAGVMLPPGMKVEDRFNPLYLTEHFKEDHPDAVLPVYFACGEEDMLYPMAKESLEKLRECGFDVTWVSEPGYRHEWRFWDRCAEAFLDWIPRTDAWVPANGKRGI
jgi:putative tributyrin esterase